MGIVSTADAAEAIPEVLMVEVLDYLRDRLVLANLVRRDVREEPSKKGATISVVKLGDLSVQDKGEKSNITFEAPENTSVDLNLNQHKVVGWAVESRARAVAIDEALDYGKQAINRLATSIEDVLAGTYVDATTEVGAGNTAITPGTLLDAWEALQTNNVPDDDGRFACIHTKDGKNLLDTDKLTKVNESGDNGDALRRAEIGMIYGMEVYTSNRIIETPGPVKHNLAGHRDGIVLGMRPLELPPERAGVVARVITDEETGLAFRMIASYGHGSLGMQYSLDVLFGAKMIDDRLMVEILS
jgi:hypothetical protein